MENLTEEATPFSKARIMEAIIGEVDFSIRAAPNYADTRLLHYLLQELVRTVLLLEDDSKPVEELVQVLGVIVGCRLLG